MFRSQRNSQLTKTNQNPKAPRSLVFLASHSVQNASKAKHPESHTNRSTLIVKLVFLLIFFWEDLSTSPPTRLFEDDGLVHGRPHREIKQRYMNVYACTNPISAKLRLQYVLLLFIQSKFLWWCGWPKFIPFNQIILIILVKTTKHTGSAMLLLTVVF